ncbi:MAG: hypothetical protein ACK41T_00635, partial [Pseudobdellovibrio sp.]
ADANNLMYLDSSGTIYKLASTSTPQIITNKDIDLGTASNRNRLTISKDTKSNLDSLTRKEATLVYATDQKKAFIDDGSNLVAIGSGSGSINLVPNPDGSLGTTGWVTGVYSSGDVKPIGTFNASGSDPSISVTTTNPLGNGTTSFIISKTAVDRQKRAIEISFPIPLDYKAKVLSIQISNIVMSGTFNAGSASTTSDLIWYCSFSNDNGSNYTLSEPSNYRLFSNSSTISEDFSATIQTPSDVTHMKLIAYVASTNSNAWQVKTIVKVSPCEYIYGSPITDWQSYTPTITGFGTPTGLSAFWRRVGSNLEIRSTFTTGTVSGVTASISLPSGYNLIKSQTTSILVGDCLRSAGGGSYAKAVNVFGNNTSTTLLFFSAKGDSQTQDPWVSQLGTAIAGSAERLSVTASVPIEGWSSSVQMSDSFNGRQLISSYYGPLNTAFADNTWVTVRYGSKFLDTAAVHDSVTGVTTVLQAGNYTLDVSTAFVIAGYVGGCIFNSRVGVTSNGSTTNYVIDRKGFLNSTSPNITQGAITLPLKAGDTFVIQAMKTNFGGNSGFDADGTQSRFSLRLASGNQTISANELIAASYWCSANTASSTTQPINFDSKEFDTHGIVTVGSGWKVTAPVAGIYEVSLQAVNISNVSTFFRIYKNGVLYKSAANHTATASEQASSTVPVYLLAGEYIDIRPGASVTVSGGLLSVDYTSKIYIKKVN